MVTHTKARCFEISKLNNHLENPSKNLLEKPFSAWCPLKCHSYLNKPLSMYDLLVDTSY